MMNQNSTPIYEALLNYQKKRIVSFDVPGHKQGKGHQPLVDAFSKQCLQLDYNSSKPLDNLSKPTGVILQAEQLAAQAFRAKHAFLMLNGTTQAIQVMIMCTVQEGDYIILPRNVHKSAINALILCGAIPVYVDPGIDEKLGIAQGMSIANLEQVMKEYPHAKAILVNNPTYYGVCSHLELIVKMAKKANMKVLVDEAHGTHLYFSDNAPISAMDAKADYASVSLHKTGGSLSQSSLLLINEGVSVDHTRKIINVMQTTSGSYLLMASLDIARKDLYLNGHETFVSVNALSDYARLEINKIEGFYAYSHEMCDGDAFFAFDNTKLSILTYDLGLSGIEVYNLLRDEYNIQIEFGDLSNILAIISVGDRLLEIERLIAALAEISRLYKKPKEALVRSEYVSPVVKYSPKQAFYATSETILFKESVDRVSCEFVMAYPPGIPILAPGELITQEIIDHITFAVDKGCFMMGTLDDTLEYINVIKEK